MAFLLNISTVSVSKCSNDFSLQAFLKPFYTESNFYAVSDCCSPWHLFQSYGLLLHSILKKFDNIFGILNTKEIFFSKLGVNWDFETDI